MTSYTSPSNACGLPPGASDADPRLALDWSLMTIAALVLVTLAFAWLRNDPQFATAPKWYWRMKLAWKHDADMVFVGDSTVYRGLNPQEIENAGVATRALNFGFSSAALSREYLFDAASKMEQGSTPKCLVVGVTHWSLTPLARKSNGYLSARLEESKSRVPLAWAIAFDSTLERMKPIQINLLLGSPDAASFARATESEYIQRYHMNGWVESDYVHPDPARGLGSRRDDFKDGNMVQAALIEEARSALQKIQDRDSVQVILVPMRSHHEVDLLSEELGGIGLGELSKAICPSRGIIFDILPRAADSYDGVHLNSDAAGSMSRSLADFVKHPRPPLTRRAVSPRGDATPNLGYISHLEPALRP